MLADYLEAYLGATLAGLLGWASATFDSIAAEVFEKYDLTEASDPKELHALAKLEMWTWARNAVTLDYDFRADGADYKRGQLHQHVQDNLAQAVTEALPYLPEYVVGGE